MQTQYLRIHDRGSIIEDVAITAANAQSMFPEHVNLEFVSLVDVSAVPLYFVAGPSMTVETSTHATAEWFQDAFSQSEDPHESESSMDGDDMSNVAILTNVIKTKDRLHTSSSNISITQIVFFIHPTNERLSTPPTPPASSPAIEDIIPQRTLKIMALPLSSSLNKLLPPSPPLSPVPDEPTFLPSLEMHFQQEEESRKRKRVADVLNEASETQRLARRRHFQVDPERPDSQSGKSNAINILVPKRKPVRSNSNSAPPLSLGEQGPTSISKIPGADRQPQPPPTKTRRIGVTATTNPRRTSTLSRVASFPISEDDSASHDLETRNKEIISRAVMTGMRLYGLQQRKKTTTTTTQAHPTSQGRHSRTASTSSLHLQRLGSSTPEHRSEDGGQLARVDDDEEYRTVYHQTYRGVICAFRKQIGREALVTRLGVVQDVVDRLLGIFCVDPLAEQDFDGGGSSSIGAIAAALDDS